MPEAVVLELQVEGLSFNCICQWPWVRAAADFVGPDCGRGNVLSGEDLINLLPGLRREVLVRHQGDGLMAFVAPREGGAGKNKGKNTDEDFTFSAHLEKAI